MKALIIVTALLVGLGIIGILRISAKAEQDLSRIFENELDKKNNAI